jgi:hypothetical protein
MKWYVLQLCVKTHGVELDFFLIFLPYSFRLIGPQTRQGYIHPWSVKIGLRYGVVQYTRRHLTKIATYKQILVLTVLSIFQTLASLIDTVGI